MTQITAAEAFKSKANFDEFLSNAERPEIKGILEEYPENSVVVEITDLTQNIETLLHAINEFHDINPYIIWTVATPKNNLLQTAKFFNRTRIRNVGIFVFQAILNNDKMEFKCILKPNKILRLEKNENTPTKIFDKNYWEKYFEICDTLMSDMQIRPSTRHFQTISINKKGVQLMQTVSKSGKYVASELYINNDKSIYDKLFEHKSEIEEELGELSWLRLDNKKASRIVKYFNIDIENPENIETAINEHIKMGENLKATFSKYI